MRTASFGNVQEPHEDSAMPMNPCVRVPALLLAGLWAILAVRAANLVKNGSFEKLGSRCWTAPLAPWKFWEKGAAKVAFVRDAAESAHGVFSVRISKDSPEAPERYGMLEQKLTGLTPGCTLRFSLMMKGRAVRGVWFGDWRRRVRAPAGDFDWRRLEGRNKLAPGQTEFTLRVCVEGRTSAVWIDDVRAWPDSAARPTPAGRLFLRRMQPMARPGVVVLPGLRPFIEKNTGFRIVVRNPERAVRRVVLHWTLCDALGVPLASRSVTLELGPGAQRRFTVPANLAERRVAALVATLTDAEGQALADALDFVTAPPATLEPIRSSPRFGMNAYPFFSSREVSELFLDQMAAGGCGVWRYSQMDRSFDNRAKRLNRNVYRRLFDAVRARGVRVLPILAYGPVWASTAKAGASASDKRMGLPQLDVWGELVKEFVAAHGFRAVEVWNEPDGSRPLGYPKHVAYAKLLNATYASVKAVDPSIVVIGCSTQGDGTGWPESVLKAGGKMDAISFHPYRGYVGNSYRAPSIEKHLGERSAYPDIVHRLNRMSRNYNHDKPLPLYATEIGFMEFDDNGPRIHGMPLYKSEYLIRSYLTLAGLGVVSTQAFLYGGSHGGRRYDLGQRPDFSLRPDWWATRTLHEIAAARRVGDLTRLTDDMFAVPLAGETGAAAVWTVEDAALVGVTGSIAGVRDLFGRNIAPLRTKTGRVVVVPAGSVIYIIGTDDKLTLSRIRPLLRLRADTWKVAPGGAIEYTVEETPAAAECFPDPLPRKVSVAFAPWMARWAVGEARLSLGNGAVASVPVFVPVKNALPVRLVFNERGCPEVRIENNGRQAADVAVEIAAGGKRKQARARLAAGRAFRVALPVLPKNAANPLKVEADLVLDGRAVHLSRRLYFARVPKAAIRIDGRTGDWRTVPRIPLTQWSR